MYLTPVSSRSNQSFRFLFLVLDIETRFGRDCIGLAQKRYMAVLNIWRCLAFIAGILLQHAWPTLLLTCLQPRIVSRRQHLNRLLSIRHDDLRTPRAYHKDDIQQAMETRHEEEEEAIDLICYLLLSLLDGLPSLVVCPVGGIPHSCKANFPLQMSLPQVGALTHKITAQPKPAWLLQWCLQALLVP